MNTAIIGIGSVGLALASSLDAAGIKVRFGVRDPLAARKREGLREGVPVQHVEDAAAAAEIVFLAVPASAAIDAARAAGPLHGKILIDCTNPLRWENGPVWNPPAEGSVTAALSAAIQGIPVVKGFNHFGAEIHARPSLAAGPSDAFFAGDDAAAKGSAMEIARRIGFRPHDAGPLRNAAVLENLAVLWIHLALISGKGRDFSFRIESIA